MRKLLLASIIILTALIFIGRLSYLQLIDNTGANPLNDTAIKAVYDYPERGYVYDRNGKLLVSNQPAYDIMVIPRDVKPLDTLEFCKLLNITKEDFIKKYNKAYTYSPRLPSVFVPQFTKSEYAMLQEKMRKYEGFYIQKRSLRHYETTSGANVLGYISEVNEYELKSNPYYQSGELIGRQGVERVYEEILRGRKGVKFIQKDRFNRELGPYKNGIYDTLPIQGKDITITIDKVLQDYGEQLMVNKRGGIVAIEPKTGEILAMVSAPYYDPALLVGRERSKNYTKLYRDSLAKPLYDRGILAEYPPGSPFKILNGLIGLEEGVIDSQTTARCFGGYHYGRNRFMGCHCGMAVNNLESAIYKSCNAYFADTYKKIIEKYNSPEIGLQKWAEHLKSFGLGDYLGNDLSTGRAGRIPDSTTYNKTYPDFQWRATTTISNGIGQGEILTTPIQLANVTAAIANRGYYITPHIIRKIENDTIPKKFTIPNQTTISKEHFNKVILGMWDVYTKGTARGAQVKGINIAGKTGTAQNKTKIDGKIYNLQDHSIFIAFAPVENPKIALAVFVENAHYGSQYAAPIASLMIEKYLRDSISRTDLEKRMFESSLQEEYNKVLNPELLKRYE